MLKITDLHVGYGDIQVVWGVSMEVPAKSIVALLGSNGAGKTTTLKAVMGLLRPKQGKVHFRGEDITGKDTHSIVCDGIGIVPEEHGVFATLSVLENLELGAFPKRCREVRHQTLARVYDIFPRLADRKEQLAGTLSGGERRMLAIGRVLMSLPELIILDEPSLGLAPLIVENMFEVIQRINEEGVTVLIVEQNVNLTLEVAQHAYVIENGRITAQGTGEELLQNTEIQKAYLGL
jgi:branched-chain amino acid transport system ATP-binding protein